MSLLWLRLISAVHLKTLIMVHWLSGGNNPMSPCLQRHVSIYRTNEAATDLYLEGTATQIKLSVIVFFFSFCSHSLVPQLWVLEGLRNLKPQCKYVLAVSRAWHHQHIMIGTRCRYGWQKHETNARAAQRQWWNHESVLLSVFTLENMSHGCWMMGGTVMSWMGHSASDNGPIT